MKLRRPPLPLSLLLFQLLPLIHAASSSNSQSLTQSTTLSRTSPSPEAEAASSSTVTVKPTSGAGLGTKDAPFDGKDGRPHLGPFVETAAQRDRKKAKEAGEEEALPPVKKPPPKDLADGGSGTDSSQILMPESNDGVMDDPDRVGPKEGTRGTEGGISEKNRDRKEGYGGSTPEKTPDPPKEVPPLPHSEQEQVTESTKDKGSIKKGKDDLVDLEDKEKSKGPGGLEKPVDLPEKPHDIPHPLPAGASKDDALSINPLSSTSFPSISIPDTDTLIQPLHSFLLSATMIIFSEIGDKTFLIAALMAMKHDRLLVFTAAFSALITMTVLSAVLGHAVPSLIPERFTAFLAALLFIFFGAKMLREGYAISPEEGVTQEMKEVEMELEEKEELARKLGRRRSSVTPYMLEAGRGNGVGSRKSRSGTRLPAPPASPPSSPDSRDSSPSRRSTISNAFAGINNLCSLLLSPAWVQTFIMTFLGEWGDRSQIATIAMAAGQDYWWVTGGAVSGHALCTAAAVIGGRAIAGKVSLRVVTLGGGFAFLVFGLIYLVEAVYYKGTS